MRLPFVGLVMAASVFTLGVVTFSACSNGDARPDAGSGVTPGSSGNIGSSGGTDSGSDSGNDGDSGSCSNNVKDGSETDVDCGGQCKPCDDGKLCTKKEDCEQGHECEVAEVGKPEKRCRLGTCSDGITNGAESDIDCGGATGCNRCTVGKRCAADADCRSESCNTAAKTCACPPNMTIVTLTAGGSYCIDTAEVTKGEYFKFISANITANTQTGPCAGKATNQPSSAWPAQEDVPASNGRAYNYGLPVHYVDWCDATAYCKWAKKELCGKIGGGSIPQNQASVAGTAAWYNACSGGGARTWPYSGPHQAGQKCNEEGGSDGTTANYGYSVNQDDGIWRVTNSDNAGNITGYVNTSCLGGFDGLFQMGGNVAEWENSCSDETTPGAMCNVRGGSYNAAAIDADAGAEAGTSSRCDAVRQVPRNATGDALKDIGFRCCLY